MAIFAAFFIKLKYITTLIAYYTNNKTTLLYLVYKNTGAKQFGPL